VDDDASSDDNRYRAPRVDREPVGDSREQREDLERVARRSWISPLIVFGLIGIAVNAVAS